MRAPKSTATPEALKECLKHEPQITPRYGAARPSEEIVPLQRMARLCARWRAESEKIWKAANGYPQEKDRIRADTLDSVADELELELGAAGAGPSKHICD